MNEPVTGSAQQSGVIADLLETLWAPSSVFERVREKGAGKHILVLSLILLVVMIATWKLIQPYVEAGVMMQMQAAAAKSGQSIPPEAVSTTMSFAKYSTMIGTALMVPFSAVISGFLLFLACKLSPAKLRYGQTVMIATLAIVPRLVGQLLMAVQGIFADPQSITSMYSASLGVARFMDPKTASPAMMGIASNIDIFGIWQLVLFAIGVSVMGRVSRGSGAFTAILAWAVGLAGALIPSMFT